MARKHKDVANSYRKKIAEAIEAALRFSERWKDDCVICEGAIRILKMDLKKYGGRNEGRT